MVEECPCLEGGHGNYLVHDADAGHKLLDLAPLVWGDGLDLICVPTALTRLCRFSAIGCAGDRLELASGDFCCAATCPEPSG